MKETSDSSRLASLWETWPRKSLQQQHASGSREAVKELARGQHTTLTRLLVKMATNPFPRGSTIVPGMCGHLGSVALVFAVSAHYYMCMNSHCRVISACPQTCVRGHVRVGMCHRGVDMRIDVCTEI